MKHLLHLLIALFITTILYAQAPQRMTYQAIVRDANSNLIQNKTVGIRISILQGTSTGPAVYVENHIVPTNANGLVSLEVGGGIAQVSFFNSIDWSKGPYYIKTETDPTGGTNYTISGVSQLLSVPYALYAVTSGSSSSSSSSSTSPTPVIDNLTSTSSTSALSAYQGKLLKDMIDGINTSTGGTTGGTTGSTTGGTTTGISNLTGDVTSIGNVTKIEKLQGNPVVANIPLTGQTLLFDGIFWAPRTLTLSGDVNGAYTSTKVTQIQNIPIAPTAPASGQSLRFNGVAWIPEFPYANNVLISPQIPGLYAVNVQDALNILHQQITTAAGGGLTSVYHDSSLSGNGISSSPLSLADYSVSSSKLIDKAVTLPKLADISSNTLIGRSSSGTGAAEAITIGSGLSLAGGVLSATGSSGGGSGSGTITAVNAGNGLTGGGTSGSVTLGLGSIAGTSILGNAFSSSSTPTALSASQVKTMLSLSKSDVGLNNVDNTSDLNKPISTATQTVLDLKEDKANKSTDGTLSSNSDTKYPSEKAVKTYVDSKVSSGGSGSSTVSHDATLTGSGTSSSLLSVADKAVTYSKMADIASSSLIGRTSTGNGSPESISIGSGLSLVAGVLSATGSGSGSGTGSITGVTAGTGLVGGGTSGAVTIGLNSIANNTVLGNISGSASTPTALSATSLKTMLALTAADLGLGNVNNTSDANKPISTATQTALNLKEDKANKSTDGTLASNSDTKYPSEKAVKTYVDAKVPAYATADANKVLSVNAAGTGVTWATPTTSATAATVPVVIQNGLPSTATTVQTALENLQGEISTIVSSGGSGTVTGVSVNTANGFKGAATTGAVPAITLGTTVTGLVKGDGTGLSAAIPGTDYLLPTMTANRLLGSGLSGTSATEISLGNGLSFTGNTLNTSIPTSTTTDANKVLTVNASGAPVWLAPSGGGGSGTVTGVTVATTNGFKGTATAGAVPDISLGTTVTGLLKGDATSGTITAATAGTDYLTPTDNAASATKLQTGKTISISGDLTYTSPAFDGSTNVTAAGTISNNAVTTAKIASNAVTYAKMQSMTANKLLGSGLTGTAVSEITLGSGLSYSGTTLNTVAPTPASTDAGKVLTANASGSATWQTPSGGGSGISTASNGLTVTSSDVALGGTLTKNTTVDQGANTLTFSNTGLSGSAGRTIFNGTVQMNGAVYAKIRTYTGTFSGFTVNDDDYIINIQIAGAGNITLPNPTTCPGRVLMIRNNSVQAGTSGTYTYITYTPVNNTSLAASRGEMMISDGTSWYVIAGF